MSSTTSWWVFVPLSGLGLTIAMLVNNGINGDVAGHCLGFDEQRDCDSFVLGLIADDSDVTLSGTLQRIEQNTIIWSSTA